MHSTKLVTALCLWMTLPAFADAQAPEQAARRQAAFQTLNDSQWVRLSSSAVGHREGRVLERSTTDVVLSPEPQPLRVPATSIDTLWTRGSSAKTGLIVGALLGVGLGVLLASQAVEEGEQAPAEWLLGIGAGGAVGGGLLGGLVGLAIPKWHRRFP